MLWGFSPVSPDFTVSAANYIKVITNRTCTSALLQLSLKHKLTTGFKILHPKVVHIFDKGLDLFILLNCIIVFVVKMHNFRNKTGKEMNCHAHIVPNVTFLPLNTLPIHRSELSLTSV